MKSTTPLFVPSSCADIRPALFFYLCVVGGIIVTFKKIYPDLTAGICSKLVF